MDSQKKLSFNFKGKFCIFRVHIKIYIIIFKSHLNSLAEVDKYLVNVVF